MSSLSRVLFTGHIEKPDQTVNYDGKKQVMKLGAKNRWCGGLFLI
jgi:hypothetical protein